MAIQRNVYRTNSGYTYDPMEERASLLRQSRKKLNRVSRSLNEEDLEELLGALNSLSDILKGKRPDETVENECDCDPKQPGCDCHNEDDEEEVRTPEANAIVRNFKANIGHVEAERVLNSRRKRENGADDNRTRLVRNALGAGNASFLEDDDIVAIAKRRR